MANQEREPFVLDFPNGQRVEDILKKADQLPTKAQLDQQLGSKATMSDVERETQNLQNQINEIVRAPESGGDVAAEVYQARVGADGKTYQTLKARLDAEEHSTANSLNSIQDLVGLHFYDGYYIDAYGNQIANGGRLCTDFIICNENQSLSYVGETDHPNISGISFYDADKHFISGEQNAGTKGSRISTVSPDGTCFCKLSTDTATLKATGILFEHTQLPESLSKVKSNIDYLDSEVKGFVWTAGYISPDGVIHSVSGYSRSYSQLLPCPAETSITYAAESDSATVAGITFFDESNRFISSQNNTGIAEGNPITITTPANTWYCRLSVHDNKKSKALLRCASVPIASSIVRGNLSTAELTNSINTLIWHQGLIHTDGQIWSAYPDRRYSDYLICEPGTVIEYASETNHSSVNGISFYDADFNYISGESQVAADGSIRTITVPESATYLRISTKVVLLSSTFVKRSAIPYDNAIMNLIGFDKNLPEYLLNDKLDSGLYTTLTPVSDMNRSGCTFNSDGSITVDAGGYYFPVYKSVESAIGDIIIRFQKDFSGHIEIAPNSIPSGGGTTPYIPTQSLGDYEQLIITKEMWETELPYMTFRFDNRSGTTAKTISKLLIADSFMTPPGRDVFYVSNQGSDTNDGTSQHPLATVNAALDKGAQTILIAAGIYEQTINLGAAQHGTVDLRNNSTNGRVIFTSASATITSSEESVSGYTRVFVSDCSVDFPDNNRFIWMSGVADTTTLISDAERHPLERGKEYRCEDTRITRCAATELSAALTEIETSTIYRWFFDSANSKLYFSRPEAVSEAHPIAYSSGSNLFSGNSKKTGVIISGIETRYIRFNVTDLPFAYVSDCRAANIFGSGCFVYDRTRTAQFIRCEATNAQSGSNGDGFNAHSYFSGDAFAKQTTVTLIDCWSHDNNDDGYSDHERSETTIIGGLYEYNRKGGVTPSYGSHCTCYSVYSRNNYAGFYYTGAAEEAEGGKFGQLLCIACVAQSNRGGGTQSGFRVDGAGNTAKCISCKSIDNGSGYSTGPNCTMYLVDCGTLNDSEIKSGTISVANTTIVT